MAHSFDPKKVLRQISHHLLNDLFQVHGHELDIPWEDLAQTEVDEIFAAWQALAEEDRRTIEIVLHDVSEMANEDGVRAIVEEAVRQENQELIDDIEGYDSRHDKAVWTYIKAPNVWDAAVRFARADVMSRGATGLSGSTFQPKRRMWATQRLGSWRSHSRPSSWRIRLAAASAKSSITSGPVARTTSSRTSTTTPTPT